MKGENRVAKPLARSRVGEHSEGCSSPARGLGSKRGLEQIMLVKAEASRRRIAGMHAIASGGRITMRFVRGSHRGIPAPESPRRGLASKAVRLASGVALTATLVSFAGVQPAFAQDDTITLTRGGSTITVSPGHADAVSAVAEAHASPGHAETIAAGARAVADCVDGALAEGAAALAVAHPDEGALTESAAVTNVASNQSGNDATQMSADDMAAEILANNRAAQMAGLVPDDGNTIRKDVEDRCGEKERKVAPPAEEVAPPAEEVAPPPVVVEVPVTGTGVPASQLASLFAAAAAAAAAGAVGLSGNRRLAFRSGDARR
jgi:hypothetical protein